MNDKRRRRTLVVDESTTYVWTVRHRHGDGRPCQEVLTLHRDGVRTHIVFQAGEGRYVGSVAYGHSGGVGDRHHHLNLNRPGVVRALVDEAVNRELLPLEGELNGWELFTTVALSQSAGATPEVPPDCPQGP
ncbi:hypothetical protein ACFWBB_07875 [Streptomyces sp. NPDC060000]|uniref:hypothetical protein n=1 Tax=Streptomyces sp. NPDC060000 TaxID=3347031 RepID=UPI00367A83BB